MDHLPRYRFGAHVGFIEEVEALRRANLIRGGSLRMRSYSPKRNAERDRLRFSDEFVRHKILDIIGDFALLGMTLQGRVKAERSGHLLHAALMSSLAAESQGLGDCDLPAGRLWQ